MVNGLPGPIADPFDDSETAEREEQRQLLGEDAPDLERRDEEVGLGVVEKKYHLPRVTCAVASYGDSRGRPARDAAHGMAALPRRLPRRCPRLTERPPTSCSGISSRRGRHPALWTIAMFAALRRVCREGATVHTYSASTSTRSGFLLGGFRRGRGRPDGRSRRNDDRRDPHRGSRGAARRALARASRALVDARCRATCRATRRHRRMRWHGCERVRSSSGYRRTERVAPRRADLHVASHHRVRVA